MTLKTDFGNRLASRQQRLGTETAFETLAKAKKLEAQGKHIIHLEIGEPDFDTPDHIRQAAKDALDGKVTWTLTGDIYESQTHTLSIIAPTAGGHWDGLQPATLDATLDVGGVLVTQTVTVYFRGCT